MPNNKGAQKSEGRDLKVKTTIGNDEPTVTPTPINPPPDHQLKATMDYVPF